MALRDSLSQAREARGPGIRTVRQDTFSSWLRTPRPVEDNMRSALASPGKPLDPDIQTSMAVRLGHDFGAVRVHADHVAARSAQDLNAEAYTVGQHVLFGPDRYRPGTPEGQSLLAHELLHTVQQRTGPTRVARQPINRQEPDELPPVDALPPLRISHVAGATVILVGSPAKDDLDLVKFASNAVEAIPKIRAALPDTAVTILLVTPGFIESNTYDLVTAMLRETGANLVEVTNAAEVVSFLNTGLVTSDETTPTRWLNITRFFYFGHGNSTELLLNWGWGKFQSLTTDDVLQIKKPAFRPAGEAYLFTCNIARGTDSFAAIWASHLGQTVIGAQAKTAYNWEFFAYHFEREVEGRLPEWFLGLPYMNAVRIIEGPVTPELKPPDITVEE